MIPPTPPSGVDRAADRDPLLAPRVHTVAARALGVVCVVANGLAFLHIGSSSEPGDVVAQQVGPAPVPLVEGAPARPARPSAVPAALAAAEAAAGPSTELAVVLFDRTTGEIVVGSRGDQPYHAASLAKIVVAVDILDRRRLEGLRVSDSAVAQLRRALGPSDDEAMTALWTRFDGADSASRVSSRLGLTGTTAPAERSEWGEMSVTAADLVRIWEYVLEQIPAADRELLVSAMLAAPATGEDGFDQAFGLLSPDVRGPREAVAKQGWMCCLAGDRYLHSVGAVGPDQRYVAAFLTRIPRAQGWGSARREVDAVVEAAVGALD